MSKSRNASLDILRILAMFFILIHHLLINNIGFSGIKTMEGDLFTAEYLTQAFVNNIVVCGVNIFFLLSGYFRIRFSASKLLKIVLKVYFLYVVGLLIGVLLGDYTNVKITTILLNIAECIRYYWFIVVYLVLMMISPLLNKLIDQLSKKGFIAFVLGYYLIACLFCFWYGANADGVANLGVYNGYSFVSCMSLYIISAGIRKFELLKNKRKRFFVFMWLCMVLVNYALIVFLMYMGKGKLAWHMFSYNNPFILTASVMFFMIFASSDIKGNRFITIVSAHTLAVYLLHSGNYLYKYRGFIIDRFEPIMSKLLYLLPNAIAVFVICVFVDALFEWLLKKPYEKLTTVLSSLIIRFFDFIVHLTERILL